MRLYIYRKGFTLIELILVMAILALIMALVLPSVSRFSKGRSLVEESRRFLALAAYGRSEAISLAVPMELWLEPESGIFGLEPLAGYTVEAVKRIEWKLSDGIAFGIDAVDLNDQGQASIVFQPDGVIDSNSPSLLQLQGDDDESITMVQSDDGTSYIIENEADAP